jgi:hypothetical protein
VDHVFQLQHRWLKNQVKQVQELQKEMKILQFSPDLQPNSSPKWSAEPTVDSPPTREFQIHVRKLEQKVEKLGTEIHQLTATLQNRVGVQDAGKMDYASIASVLKSLRQQSGTLRMEPVWKEPTHVKSRPVSPLKSSNIINRTAKKPTTASLPPLPPAPTPKPKERPESKIPSFYNVRLSNAPIFLRRTSIRPPSPTKPPLTKPVPKKVSQPIPVDTKPKLTVHKRQSSVPKKRSSMLM